MTQREPGQAPTLPLPATVAADDSQTGHDDRLIHWMLEQSPLRRLEVLQEYADGIQALRHARKISE